MGLFNEFFKANITKDSPQYSKNAEYSRIISNAINVVFGILIFIALIKFIFYW